jgi:hypothetical protein
MNPTMIYYNDQNYMKSSEKTNVLEKSKYIEIKHYILRDEVQKGEVVLQYIFIDEQISKYFDERVCILKKQAGARGDDFLLKRELTTPRLGGRTDMLLIYGQLFSV